MSRYTTMTIGFLLLFVGIKFLLVESYLLTPRATQFWMERIEDPTIVPVTGTYQTSAFSPMQNYAQGTRYASPFYSSPFNSNYGSGYRGIQTTQFGNGTSPFQNSSWQTPYNTGRTSSRAFAGWPQKVLTPPRWIGWPLLFFGTVLILHGATLRRS